MDKDSTGATGPEQTGKAGATGHQGDVRSGVTHTDAASGKGGGQMTQSDTPAPGGTSGDENAKASNVRSPSGDIGGQDPEDVAERMKSTGKDSGIA